MKLKKIIPIIAAVLAVCAVAVIIVLNAKDSASDAPSGLVQNQGNTSEPTAESTAEPTESTDPVEIQLAEFKEMLSTAREMLASGEVITVNRYDCLEICARSCRYNYPDAVSFSDTTISIDSSLVDLSKSLNDQRFDMLYLLLLTMVLDRYYDCIVQDYDFSLDPGASMGIYGNIYLCTGYKEAGYETPEAFCKALKRREYKGPVAAFEFGLCYAQIFQLGELYSDQESTNYYRELIAK